MGEKVNFQDLIELLIARQGIRRDDADAFVRTFFALIEEGLEKDKIVKIKGLGTFKLIDVESRESIDVNTGERIEIKGHTKISFTPDIALRDVINKPFAHFETVVVKNEALLENTTEEPYVEDKDDESGENSDQPYSNEEKNQPPSSEATTTPEASTSKEDVSNEASVEVLPDTPAQEPMSETPLQESTEELVEEPSEDVIPENADGDKIEEQAPLEQDVQQEEQQEKKPLNVNAVLIIIVILTILLCGGVLLHSYFSDIFTGEKSLATAPENESWEDEMPNDSIAGKDTVFVASADSVREPDLPVKEPQPLPVSTVPTQTNSTVPFSQIPVKADSTSYDIVGTTGTHKIGAGETLIRISYKYYGTKDLWPYILKHNRDVIKNSNVLPVGKTIKIPELKKKP